MINKKVLIVGLAILLFPTLLFSQVGEIDSLKVTPLDNKAYANTLYKLSFIPNFTIPADAQFVLTFPEAFDLSQVNLAGSNTMDGGFEVSVDGQQVVINRKGEGQPVIPGTPISLLFSVVKNPVTIRANFSIQLSVLNDQRNLIADTESAFFSITE